MKHIVILDVKDDILDSDMQYAVLSIIVTRKTLDWQ